MEEAKVAHPDDSCYILVLPDELICSILSRLDRRWLLHIRLACRRFFNISKDTHLWAPFKKTSWRLNHVPQRFTIGDLERASPQILIDEWLGKGFFIVNLEGEHRALLKSVRKDGAGFVKKMHRRKKTIKIADPFYGENTHLVGYRAEVSDNSKSPWKKISSKRRQLTLKYLEMLMRVAAVALRACASAMGLNEEDMKQEGQGVNRLTPIQQHYCFKNKDMQNRAIDFRDQERFGCWFLTEGWFSILTMHNPTSDDQGVRMLFTSNCPLDLPLPSKLACEGDLMVMPGVDFVTRLRKTLLNSPELDERWLERLPYFELAPSMYGNPSVSWVMTSYMAQGHVLDLEWLGEQNDGPVGPPIFDKSSKLRQWENTAAALAPFSW